ncbi:hypothetical protein J2T22_004237 [Pseudarthrobacter defluvii]|uniref:Uncharacterized protein n=1 Tax=Pseudarthrobacter defluvii TaxID=410837 RepID=A0ABT9UN01_9MICC|nr:hypothetical protein [Pseudarthrobacter defluvii]
MRAQTGFKFRSEAVGADLWLEVFRLRAASSAPYESLP